MRDLHEIWIETLGDALTGRMQGRDLDRLDDPDSARQPIPAADFLRYTAALNMVRRANGVSRTQVQADSANNISPENSRHPCPHEAARQLQKILGSASQVHLPEWLQLCATGGFAAPPEYLPELLDLARRKMDLRRRIIPLLDARGHWLAGLNPEWSFADPNQWETLWRNATGREHPNLLRTIRSISPARGRELLAQTWEQESATVRVRLLEVMEEGLSLEDEPFLEEALRERSKTVNQQAALQLSRLPEGRLARVATEAAKNLALGQPAPDDLAALDKAGQGEFLLIAGAMPPMEFSPEDQLLAGLISVVPLTFWNEREDLSPDRILESVADSPHAIAWWIGWVTAIQRQKNARWLNALLELLFLPGERRARVRDLGRVVDRTTIMQMPQTMPAGCCDELIIRAINAYRNPLHDKHPLLEMLSLNPDLVISVRVGQELIRSMERHINEAPTSALEGWNLCNYLRELGRHIPPQVVPPDKRWPTHSPHWPKWRVNVERFEEDLKSRRKLHASFGKSAARL